MRTINILLLFFLSVSLQANADAIGGEVGINIWAQEFDARVAKEGRFLNFDSEFDIDDESDYQVYAALEHAIPLIPNVRFQHTQSKSQGVGVIEGAIFGGVELEGVVDGDLDLTHTDVVAYYEIFDDSIALDVGVSVRFFDAGVVLVAENGNRADAKIDDIIPMIYSAVEFDLPFAGWYLRAEGNFIEWDGDGIIDVNGGIGWTSASGLGVQLGYRYMDIDYSFGPVDLDSQTEGVYAGLRWNF